MGIFSFIAPSEKEEDGERGEQLNKYHNRGQEDCSKNEYNPPYGFRYALTTSDDEKAFNENMSNREAYDKGWENANKQ